MSDEITLTLPPKRDFHQVAHLVLGGLAVRLNLTFEHLEDLQLALDELLGRRLEERELTVAVRVRGDAIEARVGPFAANVRAELERGGVDGVSLARVLGTVVDHVEVSEGDDGQWVEVSKAVQSLSASGRS